jgi:hypothetical protein
VAGCCYFPKQNLSHKTIVALLNSRVASSFLRALSPTLNFEIEQVKKIPLKETFASDFNVDSDLFEISEHDWDNFEISWGFKDLPFLRDKLKAENISASWSNWNSFCQNNIVRMQELEEENNRLWIGAYGLQGELTPEVPEKEITLARANPRDDMAAFVSYAVGCMFGRFSLEAPGLILANACDTVEDYYRIVAEKAKTGNREEEIGNSSGAIDSKTDLYFQSPVSFPPDEDNIIPVLDGEWFEDDIVARFRDFLKVTFGEETLRENIQFIEESLGKGLRKYFVSDFYKDHLKTYKKRPIYWLFQSPKKSFQALIYLHRYNRDTVNLLLNDYLREFQNKLQNRRQHLSEVLASESTSARDKTAATKEQTKIDKSLTELADWERDVILPLAQQRLEIDLDDGVKQNYPKFGKALAKVTGLS